jgi:putative membrane protein insertion efficiency factor
MIAVNASILRKTFLTGLTRLLLACIRIYQRLLSPFMGTQCRFHPTCSHYACEAIQIHGPIKGSLLAAYRILRCNPFCAGGNDPVPETNNRKETA